MGRQLAGRHSRQIYIFVCCPGGSLSLRKAMPEFKESSSNSCFSQGAMLKGKKSSIRLFCRRTRSMVPSRRSLQRSCELQLSVSTALMCLLSPAGPWLGIPKCPWDCHGLLQAEASEHTRTAQSLARAQPSHSWVGWLQILLVPHLNQKQSDNAVITARIGKRQGALNNLEGPGTQQDCDCLHPCTSNQGNVRPLWVTSLIALEIILKLHNSDTKLKNSKQHLYQNIFLVYISYFIF